MNGSKILKLIFWWNIILRLLNNNCIWQSLLCLAFRLYHIKVPSSLHSHRCESKTIFMSRSFLPVLPITSCPVIILFFWRGRIYHLWSQTISVFLREQRIFTLTQQKHTNWLVLALLWRKHQTHILSQVYHLCWVIASHEIKYKCSKTCTSFLIVAAS